MNFEKCIFIGYLGWDFELRDTDSGKAVTNNCIGVTRVYYDSKDVKVEELKWIHFSLWGEQAEDAVEYLVKGQLVTLEGTLIPDADGNPDGYDDNGEWITKFNLRVEQIVYGPKPGAKDDDGGDDRGSRRSSRSSSGSREGSSSRGGSRSGRKSSSSRGSSRSVQRDRGSSNRSSSRRSKPADDEEDTWN